MRWLRNLKYLRLFLGVLLLARADHQVEEALDHVLAALLASAVALVAAALPARVDHVLSLVLLHQSLEPHANLIIAVLGVVVVVAVHFQRGLLITAEYQGSWAIAVAVGFFADNFEGVGDLNALLGRGHSSDGASADWLPGLLLVRLDKHARGLLLVALGFNRFCVLCLLRTILCHVARLAACKAWAFG